MSAEFWLNTLMRWLHVLAAVIGVGGTIAMRFVVLPALDRLPNGADVAGAIRLPFKRLIHSAIGLLLLTGLYNYVVAAIPKVREARAAHPLLALYHPLMGAKILLALVLFIVAILLLKPVPAMHANRKTWLSVNVVLGIAILLIGAFLRRLWP